MRKHGTHGAYVSGCRCEGCKAAHAAYCRGLRKRRAAVLAAGGIEAPHGSVSTYNNLACRCPACREAKATENAAYRQSRGGAA